MSTPGERLTSTRQIWLATFFLARGLQFVPRSWARRNRLAVVPSPLAAARRAAGPRGGHLSRQYLGTWVLPSGNSCDVVYLDGQLTFGWDRPPSPSWPRADVEHYRTVTFPEILRAVESSTGQRVLGVLA